MLSASAAGGIFPTIFCESFLKCPSPHHGGSTGCACLVLPQCHRPSLNRKTGRLPASSANTTLRGYLFEAAAISLCSGLQVCLPPRSLLPLQVPLQGSRGVFVQAERASLPSHALDKLAARLQAIGGARTFTSRDSQPCRLLLTARYFSSCPSDSTSRWTPCPPEYCKQWLQVRLGGIQLSPSCPFRRLHTFHFLRPARLRTPLLDMAPLI